MAELLKSHTSARKSMGEGESAKKASLLALWSSGQGSLVKLDGRAGKMAQWMKGLAANAWQPEFAHQGPHGGKKELTSLHVYLWLTRVHMKVHRPNE